VSAYKNALQLRTDASPQRIERAASVLDRGEEVVLIDGQLALRLESGRIMCEVIDPLFDGPKLEQRYRALVQSAQQLLSASPLSAYARTKNLEWLVVRDYGTGTTQLWPCG
jgi:hypothetical protein